MTAHAETAFAPERAPAWSFAGEAGAEASGVGCLPTSALAPWSDLISHRPSVALQRALNGRGLVPGTYFTHRIESAHGDVNLDEHRARIVRMPAIGGRTLGPAELCTLMRTRFTSLLDPAITTFEAYSPADAAQFAAASPFGALMKFNMRLANTSAANVDDGSVLCSRFTGTEWVFSTAFTPADLNHPVSGNRAFGVRAEGATFVAYTRAADRTTTLADAALSSMVFDAAFRLWLSFQTRLMRLIIDNGGIAMMEPPTSCRYDWPTVRAAFHRPTVPWI